MTLRKSTFFQKMIVNKSLNKNKISNVSRKNKKITFFFICRTRVLKEINTTFIIYKDLSWVGCMLQWMIFFSTISLRFTKKVRKLLVI